MNQLLNGFNMPRQILSILLGTSALAALAGCGGTDDRDAAAVPAPSGVVVTVVDTMLAGGTQAAGTAAPFQQATLSTKLMGSVTAVLVREGDFVRAGQPLVRLDARDLDAKHAQVGASVADAEAMYRDASTQAGRIRALYADSAATRAQLDAVETGLARADAGLRAARGAQAELGAVRTYAEVRAPFAGVVTKRFVDRGAFAAPGAPLVSLQDASSLRISVTAPPSSVRSIRRGSAIGATLEGQAVQAVVEGVVPSPAGNLYVVNALVPNRDGQWLSFPRTSVARPRRTCSAADHPGGAWISRRGRGCAASPRPRGGRT